MRARSSAAERPAHNRLVPGSNPGGPTPHKGLQKFTDCQTVDSSILPLHITPDCAIWGLVNNSHLTRGRHQFFPSVNQKMYYASHDRPLGRDSIEAANLVAAHTSYADMVSW